MESVGEIEAAKAYRAVERQTRRRRARVMVGFVLALVAAGGLGAYIGFARHRTAEQLNMANNVQESRNLDISWQVNRTLLQLWEMEDVEALRDAGKSR